jgi:HSP20 family molecular chaperone IbpA
MNRALAFNNPFLLGFEHIERLLERTAKAESYPPYNIEHLGDDRLRMTLAVAGFQPGELSVTVEDNQLVIRGRQSEQTEKTFLHRGIAARQFQRIFVLADGIDVIGADLQHGLLSIELERPKQTNVVRTIAIRSEPVQPSGGNDNSKEE